MFALSFIFFDECIRFFLISAVSSFAIIIIGWLLFDIVSIVASVVVIVILNFFAICCTVSRQFSLGDLGTPFISTLLSRL